MDLNDATKRTGALSRALFSCLLGALASAQSQAQTVEEFYRGKTLTLMVSAGVGGGYDNYARVFAAHFGSHPRVDEWEAFMQTLLERPADFPSGGWWAVMEPIFHFS